MNVSASYYSDIGGRKENEDAVALLESGDTMAGLIADGLGGHKGGKAAAQLAVQTVGGSIMGKPVSVVALRGAVEQANTLIWEQRQTSGMKSTLAAVWFDGQAALAANVGDTRIYQFREGSILYQSRDHSTAQLALWAGDITPAELRTCKDRHRLTRALGAQDDVTVDIAHLELAPGDGLLLCSDGFWEKIQESEMAYDLSGASTALQWLEAMRARLAVRGAHTGDNHSAIAMLIR